MTLGEWGEKTAARYLLKKGYKIAERNFRCKAGEIDIIASDKNILVFIEVKTRNNLSYGLPCEAITRTKLHHLKRAIQYYLLLNGQQNDFDRRIDVVEILIKSGKTFVHHIQGVE